MLFGDLVGFTGLAESLDPERVKQLVDGAFERLAADITGFGGRVDKVMGDGLLALFGAPVAHEDDAERAVRAALAMQTSLEQVRAETGVDIRMRIGVNTGEALVGEIHADGDYTAMGDVVNIASRLQDLAEPDIVLVGPETYEAAGASIRFEAHGSATIRGREEALEVYRAIEPVGLPGQRSTSDGPLVGRSSELNLVVGALNASIDRGRAHLILLNGEAGVGKTRLADEAARITRADHGAAVLNGRCVPYGEANPWFPIANAFGKLIGIDENTTAADARQKMAQAALMADTILDPAEVERTATGLLHLFGYETELSSADPIRAQGEAGRSVRMVLEAVAATRPVVFHLTDLHWADDVVLRMVDGLLRRMSRLPFTIVATARHTLSERWRPAPGRHNAFELTIDPLGETAAEELLDSLLPDTVSTEQRSELLGRAGGNPFFLEELVALVNAGGELGRALPGNLRGLIAARLDLLEDGARRLLEDASVLGGQGSVAALQMMSAEKRGVDDVTEPLRTLVLADLLSVDEHEWTFRSELIRDVVYSRLTKTDRSLSHYGVAAFIESRSGNRSDAATVAYHYRQALLHADELGGVVGLPEDLADRAITHTAEAAAAAALAEANDVSRDLYSRALELAAAERSDLRPRLLLGRAEASTALRDLVAARADVIEALEDADGDPTLVAEGTLRLAEIEQWSGDFDRALILYAESVDAFEGLADATSLSATIQAMGLAEVLGGEYDRARTTMDRGLALARDNGDPLAEAAAHQNLAWLAFVTGSSTEAEDHIQRALKQFGEVGHAPGQSWSRGMLAYIRLFQGDFVESEALALRALREARQRGDRWGEGMMLALQASLRLWSGQTEAAIVRGEEAHAIFSDLEDPIGRTQTRAIYGRALIRAGRVDDGLAILRQPRQFTGGGLANVGDLAHALGKIAVGEPDAALAMLEEVRAGEREISRVGQSEGLVAVGMALLQSGRATEALAALELAADGAPGTPNAGVLSALALAAVAVGDTDRASALAEEVAVDDRATYLDRFGGALARAFSAVRQGDEAVAHEWFGRCREVLAPSGDRLARGVLLLGEAMAHEQLGLPTAVRRYRQAEEELAAMGIEGEGWRRAFGAAIGANPES